MRIAHVCADSGVPVFGTKGASVHLRELTRALAAAGHDVLILAVRAGDVRPPGFSVPVRQIGDLPALLRDYDPHVVYERYSLFGTAGADAARALGVPHILEVNAPLAFEHARYRGLARLDEALRVEQSLLRGVDRIVAVSTGIERWLRGLGVEEQRIAVLPNGVDPHRFRARGAVGTAARETLGLSGPVVGFVGSLKPWHDVATLVQALAAFPASTRPQLLVVGDGPGRARLAAAARAAAVEVTFTGAVGHDAVPLYLAAVDVAVAPYAADDAFYFSPLKLLEYLAAARPVVAAEVGDIGHCVRRGETGWLYPPGDAAALAGAIREVLADPGHAAELGRAGRAHVCAEHTWERVARSVVELAESARAVSV
jgi:glycosyltransferase involved in cell wall biosynthesis